MIPNREPTVQEWRKLVRQASEEKDLDKGLDLVQQIVEKYDEENRKRPRPGDWKELYQLAVTELDSAKLRQRVADARNAILDRVEETHTKPFPYDERQQLNDALNGLRVIQQEDERRVQQYGEPRQQKLG
jgi:hypothetical protein